jgi:uncharacterized membrane protein HdeD (DUF308 family)
VVKIKDVSKVIYGLLFLTIGVLLIFGVFDDRNIWEFIWPLFILIPGLSMELDYFANRSPNKVGELVPGGILTILGLFFYFNIFTNFSYMDLLWPIFILAPAFGLFQLYIFGKRERGLLIPVGILSVIGLIFLLTNLTTTAIGGSVIGAVFILIGLLILFKRKR